MLFLASALVYCFLCVVNGTSYRVPESDLGLYCSPKSAGGNGTCTPYFCSVKDTTPDCVWAAATTQWAQTTAQWASKVSAKKCKVCTQSSDARCKSQALNDLLPRNHSVLAMYCNDKYLVVMSKSLGNYDGSLKDGEIFPSLWSLFLLWSMLLKPHHHLTPHPLSFTPYIHI